MDNTACPPRGELAADREAVLPPAGLIGVLGGMGPLATVDFMHKLLRATPAARDQDHLPMLVSSIPQVPDRTLAFRGQGPSPLPSLVEAGDRLVRAGVAFIVIPCNTAHLWFDELQQALQVPMLHVADAALAAVAERVGPGVAIGLLGTDATIESGLYARRAPEHAWLLPTAEEIGKWLMPGIAAVKAGKLAVGRQLCGRAAQALADRGAGALLLACTELPLVLDDRSAGVPAVDATDALARAAARRSSAARAPV